jgi:hypothetical protein
MKASGEIGIFNTASGQLVFLITMDYLLRTKHPSKDSRRARASG